MRTEAVLSSRIEGTESGVADLYAFEADQFLLPGFSWNPPQDDIREILNYEEALEYGLQRLESFPVSLRFIRELHERLMTGVRGGDRQPGEFRRNQNWIGAPGSNLESAAYIPPPVPQMNEALASLELYLHEPEGTGHHPLIRIALIHYQFEAIHPFLDGNGRIGRLLIILLLVHWDLLPYPLLYPSAYFERHRLQYYELLRKVSVDGAWEEWMRFFLLGIRDQAREALSLAKQLLDLQAEWRRNALAQGSSSLLLQLTELVFERPILSVPTAAKRLGVTYPTALKNVEKLIAAGILRPIRIERHPKLYEAHRLFELLDEKRRQLTTDY